MATPLRSPHKSPATPGQQRASFLWEASQSLATQSPRVSASLARTCRDFCEANAVEPPKEAVERSCERCEQPLLPGVSCSVHIVPLNTKSKNSSPAKQGVNSHVKEQVIRVNNVSYNCNFCGHRNLRKGTPRSHVKSKVAQEFARSAMETISNISDLSSRKANKTPVHEGSVGKGFQKFIKGNDTKVQKCTSLKKCSTPDVANKASGSQGKVLVYSPVRSSEISTEHFGTPEYTPMPFVLGEMGLTPATDIESMKTPQSSEKNINTPFTGSPKELDRNGITEDLNEKEDEENTPLTTLLGSLPKLAELVPECQDNGGGGESKCEASLDSWVVNNKSETLPSNSGLKLGRNSDKEENYGAQNNKLSNGEEGAKEPRIPLAEISLTVEGGEEKMGVEDVLQQLVKNDGQSCEGLVDQTTLNDRVPLSTTSKDKGSTEVDKVLRNRSEEKTLLKVLTICGDSLETQEKKATEENLVECVMEKVVESGIENKLVEKISKTETKNDLEVDNVSQEILTKKPRGRKRKPVADYTSDSSVDSVGLLTPRRSGVLTRTQRAKLVEQSSEDEEVHYLGESLSMKPSKKGGRGRPAQTPLKMLEEETQELISDEETVVEKRSVRRSSRKPSSRSRLVDLIRNKDGISEQVEEKIEMRVIEKMDIEGEKERVEISVYEKVNIEREGEVLKVVESAGLIQHPIQVLDQVSNSPKVDEKISEQVEEKSEAAVPENIEVKGEGKDMEVDNSVGEDLGENPEKINLGASLRVKDLTEDCQFVDGKEDAKDERSVRRSSRKPSSRSRVVDLIRNKDRISEQVEEKIEMRGIEKMDIEGEKERVEISVYAKVNIEREGEDLKVVESAGLIQHPIQVLGQVSNSPKVDEKISEQVEEKSEVAVPENIEVKGEGEDMEVDNSVGEDLGENPETINLGASLRVEDLTEDSQFVDGKEDAKDEMLEGEGEKVKYDMLEGVSKKEEGEDAIVEPELKGPESCGEKNFDNKGQLEISSEADSGLGKNLVDNNDVLGEEKGKELEVEEGKRLEEEERDEERKREREEREEKEEQEEKRVETEEERGEKGEKDEERVEKEEKEEERVEKGEERGEKGEERGEKEERRVEKKEKEEETDEKGETGERVGNAQEESHTTTKSEQIEGEKERILDTSEKVEDEQIKNQLSVGTEEGEFAIGEGNDGVQKEKVGKDELLNSVPLAGVFQPADEGKDVSSSTFEGNEGKEGGVGDEEKILSQEVLTNGNTEEDLKMEESVKEMTETKLVDLTGSLSRKNSELEKELDAVKKKLSVVSKQFEKSVRQGAKAHALLSLSVRMRQLLRKPKEENKSPSTKLKLVASQFLETQQKINAGNSLSGEEKTKNIEMEKLLEDTETESDKLNELNPGSSHMEKVQETQLNYKELEKEDVATEHMETEQKTVELPVRATETEAVPISVEPETSPKDESRSEETSKQLVKTDEKLLNFKRNDKFSTRGSEENKLVDVKKKRQFSETEKEKEHESEVEEEDRKRIRVVRTEWRKQGRRWKPVRFVSYKRPSEGRWLVC